MFERVLIANRGEIAIRILKTAKKLGIETVSIYSEADVNSEYTKQSDLSVCVGPAPSAQSYLQSEKIIELAKKLNCSAIHPGFGFLSENADFAELCQKNSVTFIGPPPNAIRLMGSKSESKKIMISANVPVVPGYHGENQDAEYLKKEANKIGYPVLIKAVMGGGGKGMRIVEKEEDFLESLQSAQSESLKSFKNSAVLIEKYIKKPRHIEIQVFGDKHGNYVYVFERDCSIQRRHQKVVEEAPSSISEVLRNEMGTTAIAAAKAVGYFNAGTVEFIFDLETGKYYFMEMNTRLQVEHPVTEMISKQDLVEWQFLVASGKPLPKRQEELKIHGHAIECRIYSEDPFNNFFPGNGKIKYLREPKVDEVNVRLDTGIKENDEIPIYYDPMISKLITWGENREIAIQKMHHALSNYRIAGLVNNISFLTRVMRNINFKEGKYDLSYIAANKSELVHRNLQINGSIVLSATILLSSKLQTKETLTIPKSMHNYRTNYNLKKKIDLSFHYSFAPSDKKLKSHVIIEYVSPDIVNIEFTDENQAHQKLTGIKVGGISSRVIEFQLNNEKKYVEYYYENEVLTLFDEDGNAIEVENISNNVKIFDENAHHSHSNEIKSPMPGTIIKFSCKVGDKIQKGAAILVMEAMKMEHIIRATRDLTIKSIHTKEGAFVTGNQVLVTFEQKKKNFLFNS